MVEKSVKLAQKSPETGQNFKTSYLGLGMNFLDIFRAQNDRLIIGHKKIGFHWEINWGEPPLAPWGPVLGVFSCFFDCRRIVLARLL